MPGKQENIYAEFIRSHIPPKKSQNRKISPKKSIFFRKCDMLNLRKPTQLKILHWEEVLYQAKKLAITRNL